MQAESPQQSFLDLIDGDSPLIVGLNVRQFSNADNNTDSKTITFSRSIDGRGRTFNTFISLDSSKNPCLRIELVPHTSSTALSLLSSIVKRKELSFAKKIHRFTHTNPTEMKCLIDDSRHGSLAMNAACKRVLEACSICASSGRPANKKKISLSHVIEACNEEMQADFLAVHIRKRKFEVLNTVLGTLYGKRSISSSRLAASLMAVIETSWMCSYGASKRNLERIQNSANQFSKHF